MWLSLCVVLLFVCWLVRVVVVCFYVVDWLVAVVVCGLLYAVCVCYVLLRAGFWFSLIV